jgi:hypothetical protein
MQREVRALRSRRRRLAPLLALASLCALACAGAGAPAERAGCWPRFPYRDGWLGGDGAFSVPLSPERSLWLFGDTFVGEPEQRDRAGASFVHNSIGISRCRADGSFEIAYHWGRGADGRPRAFLEREGPGWWWLQGGFVHAGRLYLGLLEVEPAPPHGPLALPFRFRGSALARIDDPDADPASWRPTLLPLSRDPSALPLAALRTHGAHLYLFAFLERGDERHPRILLRLPLARLSDPDPGAALETLDAGGGWLPGLLPGRARILMDDDATEMSVRHDAGLAKWIALYNFPDTHEDFPATPASDAVWLRTADALEGPWSPRQLVFRIPELAPQAAAPPDPNTGCYAAKEHPQFSRPGSLTFTYVCNLFGAPGQDDLAILGRLARDMRLYRPVAAAVGVPAPAPAEEAAAP